MIYVHNVWKKIAAGLLCLALLSGCCAVYLSDLTSDVSRRLADLMAEETMRPTYSHRYYDYYIDPSIGRVTAYATSNVFEMDGIQFIMNLNVARIIAGSYYNTQADWASVGQRLPETDLSGTYTDWNGEEHNYRVKIYLLGEQYYTLVDTDYLCFASISNRLEAARLAAEMVRIARTIRVHSSTVLSSFSNRVVISGTRQRLNLFQEIAPENGAIEELFDNENFTNEDGQTPAPTVTPAPDGTGAGEETQEP